MDHKSDIVGAGAVAVQREHLVCGAASSAESKGVLALLLDASGAHRGLVST